MLKEAKIEQAQKGVVGALLCLALVIGALDGQSSRQPSAAINNLSAFQPGDENNHTKKKINYGMTADDWLALFTLALVFIGGFQVRLFYRQLKLIRESLVDAKKAADAAESAATAALLQARAAIGAERSDLIVSHISLVAFPASDRSNQNNPMANGPIAQNEFRAVVHFTNSGRSRSRMSALCVEWIVVERPIDRNADPPETPVYTNWVGTNHIFAADQTIPIKWMAGNNSLVRLTEEQRSAINNNSAWLWIYGGFVYTDFMNETYDAGFVAHWEAVAGGTIGPMPLPNPRGIVLEGPPTYIYRRKRNGING